MSTDFRRIFDLSLTFTFLESSGAAPLITMGEGFWEDLMSGSPRSPDAARVARGEGWLVGIYHIEEDGKAWEMHPSGEELLAMLTGDMNLLLEIGGREVVVELPAGQAFVVPRGTWHRQVVRSPGDYLGVTYGKGTQHRAR